MPVTAPATERSVAPVSEQQVVKKIAWRLMPLIIICYLFAFFDRVNISFAKTALQADLGLSNTAYGLGASLFVVGYVLLEVPSNLMLYRFGARRWIALINTLGQLGGIVGPVMVGAVKDTTGSTTPALYVIGSLCILCALVLLYALPRQLRSSDLQI